MTSYAVTGATGALGGLAVSALIDRGVAPADIHAVVRDPDKAASLRDLGVDVRVADYSDPAALRAALTCVDRLLLVSGSAVGSRVPQHRNVIEAARDTGVTLVAYTSILRADTSPLALAQEHAATEKILVESGVGYVLLRNGWYWENYLQSAPAAIESGVLSGAAGTGTVGGAARADFAGAAAAALVDAAGGEIYELTGDEHLTYPEIAAALAQVSGRPVAYQDLPEADYAAGLEQAGIPAQFAAILADSDAGVARGDLDSDSTALHDLLGRPTTPLVDVLRAGLVSAPA
ncbi:NAD(P)H-binding protein [Gordonia sp. NPDC003950]